MKRSQENMETDNISNNNNEKNIMENNIMEFLRVERDRLIQTFQYESAIFLSDQIISFFGMNPKDGFILAHCMYLSKQYQRAAHIIQYNHLHEMDAKCCCLLVKCLVKIKKYKEALSCIERFFEKGFDDKWKVTMLVLKSQVHEAVDNRVDAKNSLIQALEYSFFCYEAFFNICRHHMASKNEELNLLMRLIKKSRSERNQKLNFLTDFMIFFYYIQLKKYDEPDTLKIISPFKVFLKNTDFLIALAERHFYNFELNQALEITSSLNKRDLHNFECLEIHISCLLDLERSVELFELSQDLINLYPQHEISWFALGCYYHLIKKKELSRKYLEKSVTLNNLFAPSWLLFGNSYSEDAEHDYVMAAYFKASHLMPGCHLPLLYIGVEYAKTEHPKLGEKFILKALSIAPHDPLVLNELGVTALHSGDLLEAKRLFSYSIEVVETSNIIEDLHKDEKKTNEMVKERGYDMRTRYPIQYEPLFSNMGYTLYKLDKNEDAVKYLKKSLSILPLNPSVCYSLGLVYLTMGEYGEVIKYLHMAMNVDRKQHEASKELLEFEYAHKYYPDKLKKLLKLDYKSPKKIPNDEWNLDENSLKNKLEELIEFEEWEKQSTNELNNNNSIEDENRLIVNYRI